MKTARRILSILLLIVLGLLVGYLCYTGSRLSSESELTIAMSQIAELWNIGGFYDY